MLVTQPKLQPLEPRGRKALETEQRGEPSDSTHVLLPKQILITQDAFSISWEFIFQKILHVSGHLPGARGVRPNIIGIPESHGNQMKLRR